jgi:CRP-like cAMP-binding protein
MKNNSLTDEEVVRSIIESVFSISGNSFNDLKTLIKYEAIKKGDIFIELNKRNSSEYFILDGYCRSFLLNPDGEDITLSFFKEQMVLSPHVTRTRNNFSNMNFEALTDMRVGVLDAAPFLNMMIANIEVRDFANTVLMNELLRKIDKEISFASLPARERLTEFRKHFAILENLIPHPMIASYLGITNISLSRLRNELAKA